jgi:hypothetical protein
MQAGLPNPAAGDQSAPAPKKSKMPVWARIIVGVAGILVMISGLVEIFGGSGGHNVSYGKDNIIYYHDATRADADALAKGLKDASYFGSNTDGVTVLLDKLGDGFSISFVIKPEKAGDPATQKFFHDLAVTIAKPISGTLTTVRLVDPELNLKQSLDVSPTVTPAQGGIVSPPVATSFAGRFSDGKVTVDLSQSNDGYVGTVALGDNQFPAKAAAAQQGLTGTFTANGTEFTFTATLDGDKLTFVTGGRTYTLPRTTAPAPVSLTQPPATPIQPPATLTQPPAVPVGTAPQSNGEKFGDFSVLGSTHTGKTLFIKLPTAQTLESAITQTADELGNVCDGKPALTGAFANAQTKTQGGAILTAKLKGADIRGVIFCGVGPEGGSATVIIATADAPKDDVATLFGFMPAPIKLQTHNFPDGSGSVGLPDGWTTPDQSASFGFTAIGPAGQSVGFAHTAVMYYPNSSIVRMAQQTYAIQMQNYNNQERQYQQLVAFYQQHPGGPEPREPKMPVAPNPDPNIEFPYMNFCRYCDGAEDVLKYWYPISEAKQKRAGKGFSELDKIIEVLPADPNPLIPNSKSGVAYFAISDHVGDNVKHMLVLNRMTTCPVVEGECWQVSFSNMRAPEATFRRDLPLMNAIMNSVKLDMDVVNGQIAAAGAAVRKASADFENQLLRSNREFQQQQEDNFNNFESQIAAQEQAVHDSSSDFIEYVRGVRDVYDTQTGQMESVDLFNSNAIVQGMNDAANDPNRFVQIPLRYER